MNIWSNNTEDKLSRREKQCLGVLVLTLLVSVPSLVSGAMKESVSPSEQVFDQRAWSEMADDRLSLFYGGLDVKASSVLVFDRDGDRSLYEKNTNNVLPLASLVKIMTALVALEHSSDDEVVVITENALKETGDNGLLRGETWTMKDLVSFMLITSSNDGAHALATHVGQKLGASDEESARTLFVSKMNEKALELGLLNTIFYNESGLDISKEQNGGYSTAFEVVRLFDYAVNTYPDIFGSTAFTSQSFTSRDNHSHSAENTNQRTGHVAGIFASKTGFTSISGGNLIVSFNVLPGKNIIAAVLGSTFNDRFIDIERLAETTLKIIREVQL